MCQDAAAAFHSSTTGPLQLLGSSSDSATKAGVGVGQLTGSRGAVPPYLHI